MTMPPPLGILAGLCAAVAAATAARLLVSPPRGVAGRLRPYAQLARSRLGAGDVDAGVLLADVRSAGAVAEVLGPIVRRMAVALGRLIDAGDRSAVESRLQHAGFTALSADDYRMRQLAWTAGGAGAGTLVGLTFAMSTPMVLALGALAAYYGASRWRTRIDRAIRHRRRLMRAELSTVAQLLAVYVRAGHGPLEAVRRVVRSGRGPVVGELRDVLGWIGGGNAPAFAYERLAQRSAEPLCGRLYRALGWATTSGGDLAGGLLALANDVRAERRDELARAAIRRRIAMLVPLLGLIAPTMLLFIAAPLPHLIFGR